MANGNPFVLEHRDQATPLILEKSPESRESPQGLLPPQLKSPLYGTTKKAKHPCSLRLRKKEAA